MRWEVLRVKVHQISSEYESAQSVSWSSAGKTSHTGKKKSNRSESLHRVVHLHVQCSHVRPSCGPIKLSSMSTAVQSAA